MITEHTTATGQKKHNHETTDLITKIFTALKHNHHQHTNWESN